MHICFVIQPFDKGKFDRLFKEVYKPALEEVELEAYRVDEDYDVQVPIDAIEEGIKNATICLADISTDNPNVWYELGFAFAMEQPVIILCSNERRGRFPFDIQHRAIIKYSSDSPSDFEKLKTDITRKAQALLKNIDQFEQVKKAEKTTLIEGLSQLEIMVLAALASETSVPESYTYLHALKRDIRLTGVTSIGYGLALRGLMEKGFVKLAKIYKSGQEPPSRNNGAQITPDGWDWVEKNKSGFILETFSDEEMPW